MIKLERVILVCNLKSILHKKGISANYLANELEERRSTINNLINNTNMNKRQIPARLFAKLCSYLEVEPSELFEVHEDDQERSNS